MIHVRAALVPLDGSPAIDIAKDMTLVGRKETCDVRLDHKSISKVHCVLVKTDGLLLLRDLGSTNGTLVNGQRIQSQTMLNEGDRIDIGKLSFSLVLRAAVLCAVSARPARAVACIARVCAGPICVQVAPSVLK